MRDEILPNFLIVGAPKAGTTAIYWKLKSHQGVFMPDIKEPHYFSQLGCEGSINSWANYISIFKGVPPSIKCIGEASVSYLAFYNKTIPLIKQKLGEPKIIIVLRNPVDRYFSHYSYYRKLGREVKNLEDTITEDHVVLEDPWGLRNPYLSLGFYSESVGAYLQHFADVKLIIYEDLALKPHIVLRDLFEFLSLEEPKEETLNLPKRNVSGEPRTELVSTLINCAWVRDAIIPRLPGVVRAIGRSVLLKKRSMDLDIARKIAELYRADVTRLEEVTGINFDVWRRSGYF